MAQILNLTNAPNQSVQASLVVNGESLTLNLKVYYNRAGEFWVMDISDRDGNALVSSLPFVTGVWPAANILSPFAYLRIGSAFVINQSGGATDRPDDESLGTSFFLLWDD